MSTALSLAPRRLAYETRAYLRRGDQVFFTFLFPVMMLALFASVFSESDFGPGINAATYYLPAMLAAGVLLSGTQNLGINIAQERSDGTLKRLAGTPLPPTAYFLGKIGQVLVTGVVQALLLLVVATTVFHVDLPTDPDRWVTFAWVLLAGLIACAWLGIAVSSLPRSGASASSVILPPILILQFISGVYLPFNQLPSWLQNVSALFPLKWIVQGMRSVFLPAGAAAQEVAGSWELTRVALVIGAWLVLGLLLARLTFRWVRKD